jgi:aromatic ring-opening dioxygenase LigB subunit
MMQLQVLLSLLSAFSAQAVISNIAVIPHGDFALDPSLINGVNGSERIHNASVLLGAELAATVPDVIMVVTPHGIALSKDFCIYISSNASGFAQIGEDLHNASDPGYAVPLAFQLDDDVSNGLLTALTDSAPTPFNVTGILPFADSEPIAIRWGEVVPLYFLRSLVNTTAAPARVVLWSQVRAPAA